MNYPKSAAENILGEIRLKTPKVQTLIGAGAGLVAAIGVFSIRFLFVIIEGEIFNFLFFVASIKIAESAALFVGCVLLIMSLTTDFVWIPNFNLNFNFNFVNSLIKTNGQLATGFIAGWLIGFALI